MIGILNYGLGNVRAFANVYKNLNLPHKIASAPQELEGVTKIILPGVGSFDYAMERVRESGMLEILDDLVIRRKIPALGICVGMQMLARSSEEGKAEGLGWIDGEVRKFDTSALTPGTLLPHMGWNNIVPLKGDGLLEGLDADSRFYFLHSYYFHCDRRENILAETDYGGMFPCVVNAGNIYGVQFHPEKSHRNGMKILENFGKMQ